MRLSRSKLKRIIREEVRKTLTEQVTEDEHERFVRGIEEAVSDVLGFYDLRMNPRSDKGPGSQIEYQDRDDTRGFFVDLEETGRGYEITVTGRGRSMREGTTFRVNSLGDEFVTELAYVIEEEPLEARPEPRSSFR
jgi:hypothetical protein